MKRRIVLAQLLLLWQAPAFAQSLLETPFFQAQVDEGKLPPVTQRVPDDIHTVEFSGEFSPGFHGGQMRLLMGKQKDIRQMVIYGYSRLVGYTPKLTLEADILRDIEVTDGRIFTLHLRKGHKWSDGHPFTSDDFRYYWEDIANDPELSKSGPPKELLIDGKPPKVEYLDQHTVRYSWSQPNPYFLPAPAAPRPLYIYKPAHYLRQFHKRYQSKERLEELIEKYSARNWMGVHVNRDRPYKATNPDLPTLQPWMNTTYPPAERFIFKRIPYYYRVDSNGRQLPCIDSVAIGIASGKLVPAKTGANETDLQGRYLRMDNYTFLKQAEKRGEFNVRLWNTSKGANIALYPNLNTVDEQLGPLINDVRFRRALSLAINRYEVNQVVYFGLVSEGQNTVTEKSTLYKQDYRDAWGDFDLDQANALLDDLGLTRRDGRGVRLMANGEPLEILIQTAGESTEETDVLALVHDSWMAAGVKLYSVPSTREVFRSRIFSGQAIMSIWSGLANGIPTADSNPAPLAPTSQYQYQWPQWGLYYQSSGKAGEPPTLDAANTLLELNEQWRRSASSEERKVIWQKMLDIHARELFSIGIISDVLHPVVVNNHLHNVPQHSHYDTQPGAYFGIYKPDTFWFDEARR